MCSGCPIPQQWPLSSCLFIQKINLVELSVSYSVSLSYVLNWGCLSPDGRLPSVSSVPKAIHEGHANNGVWIYCKSQECWWPRLQSSCDTPWNLFTPPEILGRTRGQENASNRYFFQYEGLDYLHYPCIGSCEKCLIANTGNCCAVQSLKYSLSRHDYHKFMWSYISKLMSWLLACLPNLFKNVSSVFEWFCFAPYKLTIWNDNIHSLNSSSRNPRGHCKWWPCFGVQQSFAFFCNIPDRGDSSVAALLST